MSDHLLPEWLELELAANHRGIEVRWMDYGPRKVFVLPMEGDAFYRLAVPRLGGQVLYRRHITYMTDMKWRLHPRTYLPDPACVSDGRWVVFQTSVGRGELVKLFDVVADDGTLLPLDRRVLDAILVRDGKYGAQEKAIADVERAPEDADKMSEELLEESGLHELYGRMYHDIKKEADGSCVTVDPNENDPLIHSL